MPGGAQGSNNRAEEVAKKKNRSISVFFGTIRDHQNVVYMFYASVGIPLFIIVLWYFEVSFCAIVCMLLLL